MNLPPTTAQLSASPNAVTDCMKSVQRYIVFLPWNGACLLDFEIETLQYFQYLIVKFKQLFLYFSRDKNKPTK